MIAGFFKAKTIAVIGAAREEEKVGHIIFRNLFQNKNLKVIPVNPNASFIIRQKCYASVLDIQDKVELAIIAIPAEFVPKVLEQCGKKKIKSAVIISSGFSEAGNIKLEEQIKKTAEKYKIQLLGPNVLGFISPYQDINASFFKGMPDKGSIAFISQSGAIGTAVLDASIKNKTGLSGFVSIGNSLLTDFSDFIEYYIKDKETKIITLYIESLKQGKGRRFIDVCKSSSKPIIAIKAGKTTTGAKAAKSHTAALASEQGVYESIFKQAGIISLDSIRDLFNLANIYSKYQAIGKRACIVTNAGGLGVLASDALDKSGISLPEIPDKLKKLGIKQNPIDLLGDAKADKYYKALEILDKETFFDFFLVLLTPQYMTQPIETAQILKELKKPVIACFIGGEKVERAKEFLKDKVPVFDDIEDLAVLGKII